VKGEAGEVETVPADLVAAVIFARVPRRGEVKTRLASSVGEDLALRLATAFLLDSWNSIGQLSWIDPLVATTGPLEGRLSSLVSCLQGTGDLGNRIERMARSALTRRERVLLLGADTPGLPHRFLEDARDRLDQFDAVVGPSEDGGFYLLGLRQCPLGLLDGLPWSQQGTLDALLDRFARQGLSVALLDPWFDIDQLTDLHEFDLLRQQGVIEAPFSGAVLEEVDSREGRRFC